LSKEHARADFEMNPLEKEKLKIFQWAMKAAMANEDLRNNPSLTYYCEAQGLPGRVGG
jgi:hypothetical protein